MPKKSPCYIILVGLFSSFRLFIFIFFSLIRNNTVEIVNIYAQRIGHLIYNHEMYKANVLTKPLKNRTSILLFTQIPANSFVVSFLKRNNSDFSYFLIFPFARFVFYILARLKRFTKLEMVSWDLLHPRDHINSIELTAYSLGVEEQKTLSDAKKRLNVTHGPYVSVHNRDSLYLNSSQHNDSNFHDFRDYNINDLSPLVHYLQDHNVSVIRHGDIQKPSNPDLFPDTFRDLSIVQSKHSSDDILLVADCLFYVGCSTGFSQVPFLFRKPTLLIQYVPFRLDELCIFPANTLVIPKLLRDVDSGKLLTFSEIASLNYDIHSTICPFESQGLEIVDNTPQEILEAGIQMFNTLSGKHTVCQDDLELQEVFWNSVSQLPGSTACRKVNVSIPNSFLAKYSFLL